MPNSPIQTLESKECPHGLSSASPNQGSPPIEKVSCVVSIRWQKSVRVIEIETRRITLYCNQERLANSNDEKSRIVSVSLYNQAVDIALLEVSQWG